MKHSSELKIGQYTYIQVGEKYENIEQVMAFCGTENVKEEVQFFDGGDSYCIQDIMVGDESYGGNSAHPGDFIVKSRDGKLAVVKEATMKVLFDSF